MIRKATIKDIDYLISQTKKYNMFERQHIKLLKYKNTYDELERKRIVDSTIFEWNDRVDI